MVALRESRGTPDWERYAWLEMSVIPLRHGSKHPHYRWKKLTYAKLWRLLETEQGQREAQALYRLGGGGLAALCGRVSENLLVIDYDDEVTFARVRRALRARGIEAPCVVSSRGGHVYVRSREGAVSSTTFEGGDVKGEGSLVVLPPTIHPDGHCYQWAAGHPRRIPTVSVDALGFLGVDLDVATGERRLFDATRDYLVHGHRLAEGGRNNALYAAARDYRYVGMSVQEALRDLVPVAVQSGLPRAEAEATVRSPYRHNRGQVVDGKVSIHRKLEMLAERYPWQGRTGRTDKAVFLALAERRRLDAHRNGGGVFRASYRELATIARFNSVGTIGRALTRLQDQGLIRKTGTEEQTGASMWCFTDTVLRMVDFFSDAKKNIKQQLSERSSYCSFLRETDVDADLKERDVLGRIGYQVLSLLRKTGEQVTPSAVAFVVGCHVSTARRHLKKLTEMGLAVADADGWCAVTNAVQEQRLERKAASKADERVIRFDVERAVWAVSPVVDYLKRQQLAVQRG